MGIMKRELISKIYKEKKQRSFKLTSLANFYRFTHIGMEIINLIEIADMGDQFIKLEKALNSEYSMVLEYK